MNPTRSSSLVLRSLSALAIAFLAGCAGYNHTLFVTKSNAGLDFDAKPPTAEITLSRKEAVIAPAFEDGKTPPVLASFSADIGTGEGFKAFAFGVDQTFAGGDAAVAMSKLFNSPVAAPASERFDSALTLSEPPPHADSIFRGLAAPGQARPFLFGTDTMAGLKVGWSGVGGQIPDTLKAGFNRKEFAWAPLSYSPKTGPGCCADKTCCKAPAPCPATACCKTPAGYKVHMPSFLATVDKNAGVKGQDARMKHIQYFATGEAATHLARQPAVRKALFTRMDPKLTASFDPVILGETLAMVNTIINNLAANADVNAVNIKADLANLKGITQGGAFGKRYEFDAQANTLTESDSPLGPANGSFADFISLNKHLTDALAQLDTCGKALAKGAKITFVPADLGDRLLSVRSTLDLRQHTLRAELEQNPVVQNAYFFVRLKLNGTQ